MNQQKDIIRDARVLGTPKMLLLGLQHMFAMFGATILVPILVNSYFQSTSQVLSVQVTLFCAGFGTLFFHLCTKFKVPAFLGSSFAFLGGFSSVAALDTGIFANMADKEKNLEKLKALQLTLDKIEKNFGKGSIMKLGDNHVEKIPVISSGSIALDKALGVGGYPKGRVIEIYGPESSGKTTLAIHAIAEAQKQGGIAAIIDAEHAFDRTYAAKLGVDIENLFISQPDNGEQALEIADQLIRSAAIDIIVIDSVAALTPKAEIEGNMGDSVMGLQARLMSQALRKLTSTISKTNTCCIFINQLRDKIGVMFGNPETTTGGNALKFYASVRLDIRKIGPIKDGEEILGNHTRVKVVKNKVAPPFRKAEFDIMYGEGISISGEIVDLGVECNIIKKSGSWFSYGENKLGQGRETVKQLIMDNPELAEELKQKIVNALNGTTEENNMAAEPTESED